MRFRKPLITAIVLSLAVTGPAAMAAKDKKPKPNQNQGGHNNGQNNGQNGNGRGNGQGGNGNGGGEDLTQMRFAGMDTNRDGRITRDEWRGNDNSFNQHDWNGDGVLSGIEVTPGTQRPGGNDDDDNNDGNRFDSLDRNRDGRISPEEWRGQRAAFERLDVNRDGFVSRDELALGGNDRLARAFRALDANRDLRLSRSEWQGDAAQFDRLDLNLDGFLSWNEFSRRR
ncbi:MAG TPA: hypothetical protein VKK31_13450 [Thermoanaerobaculia bacterium]|nr:hypothetical protein [Thermoanaerobaculia bacterium]